MGLLFRPLENVTMVLEGGNVQIGSGQWCFRSSIWSHSPQRLVSPQDAVPSPGLALQSPGRGNWWLRRWRQGCDKSSSSCYHLLNASTQLVARPAWLPCEPQKNNRVCNRVMTSTSRSVSCSGRMAFCPNIFCSLKAEAGQPHRHLSQP